MLNAVPFHDFGGKGPLLHFAHSNGYTPATFRQMIQPLLRNTYNRRHPIK